MRAEPLRIGRQAKVGLCLVAVLSGLSLLYAIREVLTPFALAFVLAYVLAPVVDRLEGRGLPRTLSIILVFVIGFSGLGVASYWIGDTLAEESLRLSAQFLDPESTTREITLANAGPDTLLLHRAVFARSDDEAPSFKLRERPKWPIAVAPLDSFRLGLIFAPARKDSPVVAYMHLFVDGADDRLVFELIGNTRSIRSESGLEPIAARAAPHRAGSWLVSQGIVDFGVAGPNLITRFSEWVRESVQPLIEPISGGDFKPSEWIKETGGEYVQSLLGGTRDILGGLLSGLTFVVIVPFVAFFYLKEGHRITRGLIELVPNAYFEMSLTLLHQINAQIGGYIRGQIVAVVMVASLAVVGLSLVDMRYPLPLGIVAGLANMIPFLGPLIGFFSASVVGIAVGGGTYMVVKVAAVMLAVQIIDNVLIQPTVVARSVDLHPLVVLLAVMAGSQLWDIPGMLIAVPLAGVIKVSGQTIYQSLRSYRL